MKNKDIIKAISIGLSATLALMPNVTAYAQDGADTPDPAGNSTENTASAQESTASEQTQTIENAADAVETIANDVVPEAVPDWASAVQNQTTEGQTGEGQTTDGQTTEGQTTEGQTTEGQAATADGNAENAGGQTAQIPAVYDEIETELHNAAGELDDIGDDSAVVDASYNDANEAIDNFNEKQPAVAQAAEFAVANNDQAVADADQAAQDANTALDNGNDKKGTISEAAAVLYDTDAEAGSAKQAAVEQKDQLQGDLTKAEKAVQAADQKLDNALTGLTTAQTQVDEAAKAKEAAGKAVDQAKDDYKKLLDANGITYTESEDGDIVIDKDAEFKDGQIKKAIDAAQKAVDLAQGEFKDADEAHTQASTKAESAATAVKNAAAQKVTATSDAYKQAKANYTQDDYLDDLLATIQVQQDRVKNSIEKTVDQRKLDAYYNENRELSFLMAKYMLAQDPTVDRSSITPVREGSGRIQKVGGYFVINYKTVDGQSKTLQYVNTCYYRDGDKVDTGEKHNYATDADHIILTAKDEAGGPDKILISEAEINNKTDKYQAAQEAVKNTEKAANDAKAEADAADAALEALKACSYVDDKDEGLKDKKQTLADATTKFGTYLNTAENNLTTADTNHKNAQGTFEENYGSQKDRLDELIGLIKDQQTKVQGTMGSNNTSKYWDANRILAGYMIEYQLRQQGEVTDFSIVRDNKGNIVWNNGNQNMNNYCTVHYTLNGVEHKEYFDYIPYYTNGEAFSGKDTANIGWGNSNIMSAENTQLTVSHIVVVKKDSIRSYNDDGTPKLFNGKGTNFISEADFNAGADNYQSDIKNLTDLQTILDDAKSHAEAARTIKSCMDRMNDAVTLRIKVSDARAQVDKAAQALKEARTMHTMNASVLQELTNKLNAAKENYNNAKAELDAANESVNSLRTVIGEIEVAIDNGFKVKPAVTPTTPSDTTTPAPAVNNTVNDTAAQTPAANPAVTPAAASETSDTAAATTDAAPAADAVAAESSSDTADTTATTTTATDAAAPAFTPIADAAATDALPDGITAVDATAAATAATAATADTLVSSGRLGERQAPEGRVIGGEDMLEEGVLGQREAPDAAIINAFNEGNFGRGMLLTEEGIKIPFMWWFLILILGAKGMQMYIENKKRAQRQENDDANPAK